MTELSINLHWQRAEAEVKTGASSNTQPEFNDRYDLPVARRSCFVANALFDSVQVNIL